MAAPGSIPTTPVAPPRAVADEITDRRAQARVEDTGTEPTGGCDPEPGFVSAKVGGKLEQLPVVGQRVLVRLRN
jgi:hypothetical protein